MVHRAGAVDDRDFGVGHVGADQRGQGVVFDQDCSRFGLELSASANPRASLRVSGSRLALLARAAVTPLASTIPVTPSNIAGTPVARSGPISRVKVFAARAKPRKNALTMPGRILHRRALYVALDRKALRSTARRLPATRPGTAAARRARRARAFPFADGAVDCGGCLGRRVVALRHRCRGRLFGAARIVRRRCQPRFTRSDRRDRDHRGLRARTPRVPALLRSGHQSRRARNVAAQLVERRLLRCLDGRVRLHRRSADGNRRRALGRCGHRRSRRCVRRFGAARHRDHRHLRDPGRRGAVRGRSLAALAPRPDRCRDRIGDPANV